MTSRLWSIVPSATQHHPELREQTKMKHGSTGNILVDLSIEAMHSSPALAQLLLPCFKGPVTNRPELQGQLQPLQSWSDKAKCCRSLIVGFRSAASNVSVTSATLCSRPVS